jgi:hypothetical protein
MSELEFPPLWTNWNIFSITGNFPGVGKSTEKPQLEQIIEVPVFSFSEPEAKENMFNPSTYLLYLSECRDMYNFE